MGRPPLDPGEAKDQVYQLRLTEAEREVIRSRCKAQGKTLSTWIRDKLSRAAKR